MTYFNWDPNSNPPCGPQPDGDPDDVAGMVVGLWTSGTWHDFNTVPSDSFDDLRPFRLMEITPVPEPTSLAIFGAMAWQV